MQQWTLQYPWTQMHKIINSLSFDFLTDEGWDAKYIREFLLKMSSFCFYFIYLIMLTLEYRVSIFSASFSFQVGEQPQEWFFFFMVTQLSFYLKHMCNYLNTLFLYDYLWLEASILLEASVLKDSKHIRLCGWSFPGKVALYHENKVQSTFLETSREKRPWIF